MKKRTAIRIISFLCAALLVCGGFYVKERRIKNKYKLEIQNDYSRTLSLLDARLNNISLLLEKSLYVSDYSQMNDFASKLYSESELAKDAVSKLPSSENLQNLNKFLSQVGNFSISTSKTLLSDRELSKEQNKSLNTLYGTAKEISAAISDSDINFNNLDYWEKEIENTFSLNGYKGDFSTSLDAIEDSMSDYPTLVYDGPFSDHILEKKPVMTENAEYVSSGKALETAKKFSGKGHSGLEYDGTQNKEPECYRFTDGTVTVAVTKKGGFVLYMRKNRSVGTTSLTYEKALERAKRFLEENGFENMIETYYYTDEGVCVINFAYLQDNVICYTDLMKVGVATDTGEIMLYEAGGYIANHTERIIKKVAHSADEAKEKVNKSLSVKSTSLALIPTDAGKEVRCYEFLCKGTKNDEVLVYINAQNLKGEKILILLKDDGGTLVK